MYFALYVLLVVPVVQARMNSSQLLEYVHSLYTTHSPLFHPVINLVLCDESDELIVGALDLHYTTIPQLNINQIKDVSSVNMDGSTIMFCSIPEQDKIEVNHAFAVFKNDAEEFIKRFEMKGIDNMKLIRKNNSVIMEVKTLKSITENVSFESPISVESTDRMRIDLHGIQLTVGYLDKVVFRLNGDRFEGAMGDIFHLMSEIMNFKYKPIPSIDGFYGNKVSGGVRNKGKTSEFNGIIGMLEREEVDIAGADMFMTAQRIKVADFGGKMMLQSTYCSMEKPGKQLDFMAFFKPLQPKIWLCALSSAGGLTLFLLFLAWVSSKHETIPQQRQGDTFLDIIGFSIRAFGAVETFLLPETRYRMSLRICMLTYLVLGFLVVATYNAELTSYLTSKTAKLPITQMEDILETDIKLSLPAGSAFVTDLQYSDKITYQRLWNEKVVGHEYGLVDWSVDKDETLLKAIRSNYLIVGFGDEILNFIDKNVCEVESLAVSPILPQQTGIYLRKNSPFTELFQGLGGVSTCNNTNVILGFQSTVFLFLVVGVGILLSCSILILENIQFRVFTRCRNPRKARAKQNLT
ncbi:glutamate receptor ionotropic, delta-1 isoform X2 [Eurytemora carolleeae]|uniref:glutamate receptor ionotropic, delta-1 isoform X2 n=1 Tax=Eurytemora carolleeae TaxID=1294199 RepID=UPI000C76E9D0|nr:glutamate receptor ionotropic, delta-1 isoform X2 [Eurytemora carolleeae]|eukprot:XP_023343162.1 glutamate receptor ionotropic, delta-1-like isoform X2 [Eurytemora affinis]